MALHKDAMKEVPLFGDLDDHQLSLLVSSGKVRRYPKKNVIFHEGDQGDALLIILAGKVNVVLADKNGEEYILSVLGPGNFFGEMAIIESAPRSASVITVEPCELFILEQQELSALLTRHPALAAKILQHLSQRLRKTNEQIRSLVMCDIHGRVGRCLMRLAESQGGRANGQLFIPNRPSFQEMAKMIGCSRETLSRAIKHMKENGSLTVTRKTIFINRIWE